ncbi:dihydropteroate synthase [Pullulanibacillus pueri]|uniref:Dihydropteroate synthase n=1 Tax=Pullulanibacillus pueri TaxID=1437324 RepID=A0A8J3EQY5_9BACL|nr:dihydropteroate synthase [Pullulanibacillus pueri]GGH87966.1 dihydropteroate synthase [Pullulanibacillus pueri]
MTLTVETQQNNYLQLKDRRLDFKNKTLIMGILNVTPDSFSDGGNYNRIEEAVQHALDMVAWGADIIDIGGESTRPGHKPVPMDVEVERVLPVIKAIREVSSVALSIDTYKAETAKQALEAGADIINDIWGAKADPEMANVAAQYGVPIVLMHNRSNMNYGNLLDDIKEDLQESITLVKAAGVKDHQIILDPGIGFAKNYLHNLEVMNHLEELHSLGYPILLATSRKRFIGEALGLEVHDRMEGTGATVCLGVAKGCQMVRVHDVQPIARMVKMMDAMVKR